MRAICNNCGEEQHDQIDRICITCGIAALRPAEEKAPTVCPLHGPHYKTYCPHCQPAPNACAGLLPCPMCGFTDLDIYNIGSRSWFCSCKTCGLRTGMVESESAAIVAWNCRATPKPAPEVPEGGTGGTGGTGGGGEAPECTNHFEDGSKIFPQRDCCKRLEVLEKQVKKMPPHAIAEGILSLETRLRAVAAERDRAMGELRNHDYIKKVDEVIGQDAPTLLAERDLARAAITAAMKGEGK